MKRPLRVLAVVSALLLVLAGCSKQKDTGFNNLPPASPGASGGAGATTITMAAGNKFEPATFSAKVGETVTWVYGDSSGQPHNAVADDGSFDTSPGCSGNDPSKCFSSSGQKFSFTFKKAGSYPYYCAIHGAKGGIGMAGVVEVA
jgi:plastocyanin